MGWLTRGAHLAWTMLTESGTLGALIENAVQTRLARHILAYFLRHPKGADDLKGVATWRLLDQMIHQTLEETRDALEWLVSQGYLISDSTTGSERIFRLNSDKREDAEQFMETDHPPHSNANLNNLQ